MTLLEWYVARAGGMVGFGLLTLAVLAGITLAGRARLPGWPRFAVEDVHRYLGLLAGSFIGIHVLALLVDGYVPFSPVQVLVPGSASYRPFWTALGVVAAELLVALAVTNRYRRRIPHRVWRSAHSLNFVVWLFALAHGLFAGSDSNASWALALYLASTSAVGGATVWRALKPPIARPAARAPAV